MKSVLQSSLRQVEPFGGQKLSRFAVGLTVALIVLSGPKVFSSLLQVYLIDRIAKQLPYDYAMVTLSDSIQQVMAIVVLAIYIPFFIVFLFWLRRRYTNLLLFRHHTKFKPVWAIGSFFVPFLNLVRPFHIVKETLKHSDRKLALLTGSDKALLYAWWTLFWADNILGQIVFRTLPKEGASIDSYVYYSWMVASSDLVECVLFPLFLLLILRIGSRQEQSFQEISEQDTERSPSESNDSTQQEDGTPGTS